ncbi:MAG: tetratricopeptide repeat protein [Chitinivibrionales bacterium]|nr:tetratricopeptide repeat protein [Chitinivibrionales bacterium]
MKRVIVFISGILGLVVLCSMVSAQSTEEIMSAGVSLLNNGAYDQAISKFRVVVAREPKNFEANFNLALAYLHWGKLDKAVEGFKRALQINGASSEAWANIAAAYQSEGKSSQAIDALYKAAQLNPRNTQARMSLAAMYANRRSYQEAIAQYKQVIQIDGSIVEAYVGLGKCYISTNSLQEAKHYLKNAINANANSGEAYYELGNIAWKKEKNTKEALENYSKAASLDVNNPNYFESLAYVHESQKNKDEAIAAWKKCMAATVEPFKKDEIQSRIEALEKGQSPSGESSSEDLFGKSTISKEKVDQLRVEMGKDVSDVKPVGSQQISVQNFSISNDLSGLSSTDTAAGSFNFDIKKRVKEKKSAKDSTATKK